MDISLTVASVGFNSKFSKILCKDKQMSIRDTITQRRLLMKDQLESMMRPVHSLKLTNKRVSYNYCGMGRVLFMFLHDQASKKTVLILLAYIVAAVQE